jgi:cellulose synthase/poly-beta-1,6-N-acetylglucosamine synthase-like glycosyltransferase
MRPASQISPSADQAPFDPELSVVIPCLNEADTLQSCIEKAQAALAEHRVQGEIIVADNGSTDESRFIAARLGEITPAEGKELIAYFKYRKVWLPEHFDDSQP